MVAADHPRVDASDTDSAQPVEVIHGTAVAASRKRNTRRRGAASFILELSRDSAKSGPQQVDQVLFKAKSLGGLMPDELVLTLRRGIRQGDALWVSVGKREWQHSSMLLHAVDGGVTQMMTGGSTGTHRMIEALEQPSADVDDGVGTDATEAEEVLDATTDGNDGNDGDAHSTQHCRERFVVFSRWLVSTFAERLAGGGSIVEVAGGKGELSLLLTLMGYTCELVDPREHSGCLSRKQRKQLRRSDAAPFRVHRCYFGGDDEASAATTAALLQRAALVVGLHPDEATEAIVEMAVAARVPFAVVPCCVFWRLFPARRSRGRPVTTHEQLCDYLQAKAAPRSRRARLPFAGKNIVVWSTGGDDDDAPRPRPPMPPITEAAVQCAVCTTDEDEAGAAAAVVVRPLEAHELRACAAVEAACYPPDVQEGEGVLSAHHKHHPAGCFAALLGGELVGYVVSAPARFGDCPLALSAAPLPPDAPPPPPQPPQSPPQPQQQAQAQTQRAVDAGASAVAEAGAASDGGGDDEADEPTLYLHDLAVSPAARGRGVAEQLLRRVAALAAARPITLTAVCGAAGFWARRGFAAVEAARLSEAAVARLRAYPASCDAQLMQRHASPSSSTDTE